MSKSDGVLLENESLGFMARIGWETQSEQKGWSVAQKRELRVYGQDRLGDKK